jgi:hypothetical protein
MSGARPLFPQCTSSCRGQDTTLPFLLSTLRNFRALRCLKATHFCLFLRGTASVFTFTFSCTPLTHSCTADTEDSDRASIDQHLTMFVRKIFVHTTF